MSTENVEKIMIFLLITAFVMIGFNHYKASHHNYIDWSAVKIDPKIEQQILERDQQILQEAGPYDAAQLKLIPKNSQAYKQITLFENYKTKGLNIINLQVPEHAFELTEQHLHKKTCELLDIPGPICIYALKVPEANPPKGTLPAIKSDANTKNIYITIWLNEVDLKPQIKRVLQDRQDSAALYEATERYKYAIKKVMIHMRDTVLSTHSPSNITNAVTAYCEQELRWLQKISNSQ